ncbi:DUF898 family protein [uncultured Jannaschia sp.]|uniref:DUF898 family protein n=1 Tax=uncultured Jannaschia sp. TaxID=293347 RepID=UPI0026034901|nr:DUF898 family protein [uncultured Jannaschia sp.]
MGVATLDTLRGDVAGTRGALLWLVLKTTMLSVLTLGLYSFWSRTRVRRWLWSSLRVGGAPLEYAGQPLEKLMGFVIAAVIVATYLGVIVMLLIFASLTLFEGVAAGGVAAFLLLLPVYWFAQYRGMRYLLNHTRWRGLSFAMVPGAYGYAWRAVAWSAATVLSLGIALPWRTHRLWAYRVARASFGDTRFALATTAGPLVRVWLPVWVGLWLLVGGTAAFGYALSDGGSDEEALVGFVLLSALPVAGLAALLWLRWRVRSFEILASAIRFGESATLSVRPTVRRIFRIHLLGWIVVALLLLALLFALGLALGLFAVGWLANIPTDGAFAEPSPYALAALGVLLYLTLFLMRGALRTAFVTFPLIAHVGDTLVVTGATAVNATGAGERQHMADADGFANLFDMGSGI